ncbi:MAG TPA: class I SAM-dependent methyltransferase [Bryobacteraceae bacterium]|nr:class I SAM-dependent methyltransferase [Bryobacteraceae bacterium]
MQNHWYKDFFNGVALDMWRNAVTPEMTEKDVDFLAETLALSHGARVLDVPCGNGRHSLALAKRGFQTTGVDLSAEFIEEARARAAVETTQAHFACTDMRTLSQGEPFDGAYCFGNSFAYFDHEGNRAFLESVAQSLKPRARFILETGLAAESILPNFVERSWMDVRDLLFLSSRRYNASESCIDLEYTFIRDGIREMRPARYWVYTVAEIRRLLQDVGLETLSLYGALDKTAYRLGSPRLLLVAQRTTHSK